MALVLNEEQQMLREAAKTFLRDSAPVAHLRQLRDESVEAGFSRSVWTEMADMGWPAIVVPEAYGGLGYGYTGLGLVLEETGRTLTPSPLISSALLGASALALSGNQKLCEQWLPQVVAGEKLLTLACEESPQHRPSKVETTAILKDDIYVLNGRKLAVIDALTADAFIVSTTTAVDSDAEHGLSLFLVPKNSDGLVVQSVEWLDNQRSGLLQMNDVQVGQEQLLGTINGGWPILQKVLDRGRIGIAAELLGIAQESFERSVQYLKERKQFGVAIGTFQALQHRAAILFGEIELCKSVVLKALQAIDESEQVKQTSTAETGGKTVDLEIALLASLAKAKCGQIAELATAEAIQMHGGIGMTDEFEIGFFIKRWRSLNQQLGDPRFHLNRFAQLKSY